MMDTAKIYLATIYTSWLPIGIFLFGGFDILFQVLCIMMLLDYITGIMKGYKKKNINSNRAYVGLRKKLIILIIIVAGTILDKVVPGVGIRNIILIFYTSTEFLSITENAAAVGVPIPKKLKLALEQLQK